MPNSEQIPLVSVAESQPAADGLLSAGLDDYEARMGQAIVELQEHPEAHADGEWPEGFTTDLDRDLRQELKNSQPSTSTVSRYIALRLQAVHVYNSFVRSKIEVHQELDHFQGALSETSLRVAFFAEGERGPLHQVARDALTDQSTLSFGKIETAVSFLQAVYDVGQPTELLQRHQSDDTATLSMRHQLIDGRVLSYMHSTEVRSKWDKLNPPDHESQQAAKRAWMRKVVLYTTEIDDPEEADDYVFAASRATYDWEFATADIINKINTIGLQDLRTIRDFSQNRALSDYSFDQLERMLRLAQGDPEEIARLQQHDVIVVLSNKMGDHNNILHTLPGEIDDERKRTIIFEIDSLVDVYRSLQKLHALGILPSTLIPAAHSAPGQFIASGKPSFEGQEQPMDIATIHTRKFIEMVNKTRGDEEGFVGFAIDDMRGLARLIDTWMQPSRGIDDPDEDVGVKKVVFTSCNMGVEGVVTDLDDKGHELKLHKASVVSRLAESLKESGSSSRVRLFGAPDSIKAQPTPRGFHFSVSKRQIIDLDDMQELLAAIEVELNNGVVTQSTVSEVELRNFDKQMAPVS